MYYEYSPHTVRHKRLSAYLEAYATDLGQLGACKRVGVPLLCAWTDEIGVTNRFTYMVGWESMAQREEAWARYAADEIWNTERPRREGTDDAWIIEFSRVILRLTPYSPQPNFKFQLHELWTYDTVWTKLPNLNSLFADHGMGYFQKHGIDVIGLWTHDVGDRGQLMCMLGYDSLADREKKWGSLMSDPGWRRAISDAERDKDVLRTVSNSIMRPLPFVLAAE